MTISHAENPYYQFIAFVEFDRSLTLMRVRLAQEQETLARTVKQYQALEQNLLSEKAKVHDLKKAVDRLELELKDLRHKEKAKKAQLDTVSSAREYQSLEHELATLAQASTKIDDELFEIWQQHELAQEHLVVIQKDLEQALAEQAAQREKHERSIHEIQEQIAQAQAERADRLTLVPEDWRVQYESMRARVDNPVVPVENGLCTGCFFQVSGPDLLALRRHKLLTCKDCFRILYSKD